MSRRKTARTQNDQSEPFSFVRITDSARYVEKISAGLGADRNLTAEHFYALCDGGWKLSVSQHQTHGYYTAALTDKQGRSGCHQRVFLIEHNDLVSAIRAAIFCAVEILADGYRTEGGDTIERDW